MRGGRKIIVILKCVYLIGVDGFKDINCGVQQILLRKGYASDILLSSIGSHAKGYEKESNILVSTNSKICMLN